MTTIKEIKLHSNSNETLTRKGVYQVEDGYMWVTLTKSGYCKRLATAMKKAGF